VRTAYHGCYPELIGHKTAAPIRADSTGAAGISEPVHSAEFIFHSGIPPNGERIGFRSRARKTADNLKALVGAWLTPLSMFGLHNV